MLTDLLNAANKYTDGINNVQQRKHEWQKKSIEIRDHLKEIATYLDTNSTYKPGFYVDTYHAFIEEINGVCNEFSSVTFRCGETDMGLVFRNNMGQKKAFVEKGFQLTFNPTITGQVLILLLPHHSDLTDKEPEYINIGVINNIEQFNNDALDTVVSKALEIAFHTSFAGMAEQQEIPQAPPVHHYTPIGFKKFDSTEKLNGNMN